MRNPLRYFAVLAITLAVGCAAGYNDLTAEQKSQIAFNTLDFAFDTAEAVFVLLEKDGIQHMPTARAVWTIVQSGIETYLETLQIIGIIATPDYAVEAIDAINDRAVALGVVDENEARLLLHSYPPVALRLFKEARRVEIVEVAADGSGVTLRE
ncbi:hypothetical protein LCGC14_0890320 [marine sediment metagenome]|uniref:Uncharacterized protein n=1 Tax=marine sediment metagenome TaxID=412755 RepID=A0A0F9PK90_9ZZZZ